MARILILGEHDKGHGSPFSPKTVSGKRLRGMVAELNLDADLDNAFTFDGTSRVEKDLAPICAGYKAVVAVGRAAEHECKRQGITPMYLPHPAVRGTTQLQELRAGLAKLASYR